MTKRNLAGDANLINEIMDADDSQEILSSNSSQVYSVPRLVSVDVFNQMPTIAADVLVLNDHSAMSDDDNNFVDVVDLTGNQNIEIQVLDNEIGHKPAKVPKLDSIGRGRSLDPVWSDFHANDTLPKGKVQCNFCGMPVSAKVERLRVHMNKVCKRKRPNPVSGHMSVPGGKKTSTPNLSRYADIVSKKEQEDFNLEIGKYLFSTNLPFSHAEHPAFIRLIKKLRPGCQIPSRKTVGNSILNKVYKEVTEKQEQELKNKNVTLMQDGWKTRTSEPIISHSITTGEKSYFFKATSTEENIKTSKYCARLLAETIGEVRDLGASVVAVVTDNCSSMDKMRKIISESYPEIYTYGCNAHLLNLVGKRLTPDDLIEKIRKVHAFFRGHDAAWALLKKKGAGRPIMPHDIRWNAWVECLEYYLKNHTNLLGVSRIPSVNCTDEVKEVLNDSSFYGSVEITVRNMKPIQISLDKVQGENATIADAVAIWINLMNTLDIRDSDMQKYFDKQFDRGMQPVSIAAHMLHPIYRGNGLLPEHIAKGNEFLTKHRSFYTVVAAHLKQKSEDFFPLHMFTEDVLKKCGPKPKMWWQTFTFDPLGPLDTATIQFASRLMGLPAGSADIERHFSILGNIMNVRRSRLGIEKAARLCVIYKHLAGSEAPMDDGGDWDILDEN